jgi:molybdopterin synthase catalytic subunit
MAARTHVRLSAEPLSVGGALRFVADPAAGGRVLFTGAARGHAQGRAVEALEYEAFGERAEQVLADLAAGAAERWPGLCAVWIEHRTGRLAIGEEAVVVAAGAPHREEAFAAARWLIDTLKAEAPIWKKEHWAGGGAHWPGTPDPVEAAGP